MSHTYRYGETSTVLVGTVLDELVHNPALVRSERIGKRILHVTQAEPSSRLDKKGATFLVVVETENNQRVPVPVMVRRSGRRRRRHEEDTLRTLPHIRNLPTKKNEDEGRIKEKVIQLLRSAVNLFKKGYRWLFSNYETFFRERDEDEFEENPPEPSPPSSKEMRRRMREDNGCYRFSPGWAAH